MNCFLSLSAFPLLRLYGSTSAVFHPPLQALYHLTNLTCRAGVVLLCDDLDATFSSREADFRVHMETLSSSLFQHATIL